MPDLVLLGSVSEDAILDTLQSRFQAGAIYTYIGSVLVLVNPFSDVASYGEREIFEYARRQLHERPPHIFGASRASTLTPAPSRRRTRRLTGTPRRRGSRRGNGLP